jgi:hypothetical protein
MSAIPLLAGGWEGSESLLSFASVASETHLLRTALAIVIPGVLLAVACVLTAAGKLRAAVSVTFASVGLALVGVWSNISEVARGSISWLVILVVAVGMLARSIVWCRKNWRATER